ncbi:tape measure protein [Lysinibacillus telephonicus]|uniref:tape measure protein n=1 Tax=Lysinibacillus telephonicus TaxID=1714840 RepID=UPI0031FC8B47
MATMNTGIQIDSMMSQQFNSMNIAMSTVINNFYTFQDVASQAIDLSALEAIQEELQQVKSNFNQIEQEIRQADEAQEKLNQNIENANNPANNLLGTLGAIAKSYLSLQQLGSVLSLSDDMANTNAQLDMINDGKMTTPELQQMIFDSAQRSYTSYQSTADMVGKLGMQEGTQFDSNAEIVAFVEQVNKSLSIAGTPQEDINSVMQQLTQAMSDGVLQEKDINGIFANAQPIIENIQRYLEEAMNINIDASNIQELASKGIITGEVIKNAMLYATAETNAAFEALPLTWSKIWTVMTDRAINAFTPVLQKINEIANSERMKEFMDGISNSLMILSGVAMFVLSMMSDIGAFIIDNWGLIAPIVGTATAAIGAYGLALLITKAAAVATTFWTGLQILAIGLMTATSLRGVSATLALTGVQWGLNAALAANPIFQVVMVMIALIGVFYLAVAAVNFFTGKSYSATGIIAGVFATLGAFIANVFFGLIQIVLGIVEALYNHWVTFANFFGNVFNDPIGAIIHLFGDLADNALGVIEKIASALDFVFGTDFATTVAGWREDLSGLVDWGVEEYGNGQYEVLYEELDTDKVMSDLGIGLERMEYSNAWKAGNDWGANLFNFDKQEDDSQQKEQEAQMQAIMESLGTGNNFANNTAENTGRFADSVEMAGEDLAYMKDLAEREVINRYTAAEIKVDMRNENHINSELDIDGVINRFGERAEEAADMLAEGGYTYYV